ncbi:MAG: hypothetical protein KJN64_06340 [Ignavibacteria bacterium]|nr:hypothetical protein [Ignavibacteria bacterium]MBT8383028.1 hypothetical protein [Ignavibacteria bacterium]MBT8391852.1 hypothetical protein [Ignavibacteria bacterium]NNJ53980.1 hypothetical protein [Ignavibacteriaceae bacterium]NNL21485.1 hypothetical protein [Ignavibacteriaceae bacterium]
MDSNFLAELHPKIVHFPIALLSTYAVLEIVGIFFKKDFLTKTALLILCIGVVAAFGGVLSGNEAFSSFNFWNIESTAVLNDHQMYATFLLWFSLFICALRLFLTLKKKFLGIKKFMFIIFAFIILFLVYQTGEHGGKLVTKFGIGTELNMKQNVETE